MNASNDGFWRTLEITSPGVADKKLSTCIKILRKKIHRLAEVGVPLPSNIFKRTNGSVLKNESIHYKSVISMQK
jgi:hypothetical protein